MAEEKSLFRFFRQEHNLNKNRWEPEADEFAVAFKLADLRGVFSTTLHIPSGTRAWTLIDSNAEEYNEGSETLENFVQRLNSMFQRRHGEVLITRKAALEVPFEFAGIRSAELLELDVATRLMVQVGDIAAFRNHFMREPGSVKVAHLQALLGPAVRQIVEEFCNARGLQDLLGNAGLRAQLAVAIRTGLAGHFNEYGLDFAGAATLGLQHEKTETELQWDDIKRREADLRLRYRQGELKVEEAEEMQVLREREIKLAETIAQAATREEAIRLGGRDDVEALLHDLAGKRDKRETEAADWEHLKALAALRRDQELRRKEAADAGALAMEKTRIANALEKQAIEAKLEQVRLVEDEALRKQDLQALRQRALAAAAREDALAQARHEAQVEEIRLAMASRRAADEREDQAGRMKGLADAMTALDDAETQRRQKQEEAAWKREQDALDNQLARDKHKMEMELLRIAQIGALKPEHLTFLADSPEKVAALKDVSIAQIHSGMAPEQIMASQTGSHRQSSGGELSGQDLVAAIDRAITGVTERFATASQVNADKRVEDLKAAHENSNATILEVVRSMERATVGVAQGSSAVKSPTAQEPARPARPQPVSLKVKMNFNLKQCPSCGRTYSLDADYCTNPGCPGLGG